ncbi:myogenesis-regulating glycosidase-like isoform X2 [Anticarsia gemmatalis]|uniref:myogenesis-regulating glycosidase-like isoform X2 n=1 Tax=Anticarsia gemmatalis TaxID=129554 RepID=UPI003F75A776
MAAIGTFLALLSLGARAHSATVSVESSRADDVTLNLEPVLTGGFDLVLIQDKERNVLGQIGRTLTGPFVAEEVEGGMVIIMGTTNLTINTLYDEERNARGIKFKWQANAMTRLEDCLDFGTKHWYAGPMQENQIYPVESAAQTYSASYNKESDNGAIMERYWLNSAGEYVFVHPQVPLFVDYKNLMANHICFGAQIAEPYSSKREHVVLAYDIWILSDVKKAHEHAVDNYLGKPSDTPDYRMVQHPIWSTWAQYSREINETKLMEFALQIVDYGFNNSQIEIDDLWETCYGSLTVNEEKFTDLKQTVKDLKEIGFRVTIWVHPFINRNCEPWYTDALTNGYFVADESGSTATSWWNNNGSVAGYIDFTNPRAAEWWYQRVRTLLDTYDIDSVKVDAGEASFAPEVSALEGDIDLQPHVLVQEYAKTCARFGKMVEVRSGYRNQDLPIYTRMVDRDSIWGINNGLPTIITTTFQMNLNGYPFVLPDMIGGNGFNLDHDQADLPTKELFIRWVQANTFLPVMQFSFGPWNFDEETIEISKKYAELHAEYADVIFEAMEAAVADGTPVNKPIWWIDPTDEEALVIWDEYLLGETVLVAPVLTEGATTRNIYLPTGIWYEQGDRNLYIEGPIWLNNYSAPLDTLPYFVRDKPRAEGSQASLLCSVTLVLLGAVVSLVTY